MKPGVKTTEFWLALIGTIAGPLVAVLVMSGVISTDVDPAQFSNQLVAALTQSIDSIIAVIGLITGVVAPGAYAQGRSQVKVAELTTKQPQ